mgnify:CR=1 FL=1
MRIHLSLGLGRQWQCLQLVLDEDVWSCKVVSRQIVGIHRPNILLLLSNPAEVGRVVRGLDLAGARIDTGWAWSNERPFLYLWRVMLDLQVLVAMLEKSSSLLLPTPVSFYLPSSLVSIAARRFGFVAQAYVWLVQNLNRCCCLRPQSYFTSRQLDLKPFVNDTSIVLGDLPPLLRVKVWLHVNFNIG